MENYSALRLFSFLIFMNLLFIQGCKKEKDTQKCYQVKFIADYCPKPGAVLVQFVGNSNSQIALLNVPERFHVQGKIFYVSYSYNEQQDILDDAILCPGIFIPVKIFVCDSASDEDCSM